MNVSEIAVSLAVGTGAALGLRLFFSTFEVVWPESYTHSNNESNAHHKRGPLRFILVRMFPIVVASYLAATLSGRFFGSSPISVTTLVVIHVYTTDWRILRNARSYVPSRIAYHITAVVGVLVCALLGLGVSLIFPNLAPTARDLNTAIWTAALTALMGGAYISVTSSKGGSPNASLLSRAKAEVGNDLWTKAADLALDHSVDPHVVQAVLGAEALQRPKWIRRVERHWPGAKTHGIAQVAGPSDMTDVESVKILCESLAGFLPERSGVVILNKWEVECALENHNSTDAFMSDCLTLLDELADGAIAYSEDIAADNFPSLIVTKICREGADMAISGNILHGSKRLYAYGDPEEVSQDTYYLSGALVRQPWSLRVPISFSSVAVVPENALDSRGEMGAPRVEVHRYMGDHIKSREDFPY